MASAGGDNIMQCAFRQARRKALALAAGLLCAAAASLSAHAEGIVAYSGPDREARLLEGARGEGSLTVYTSMRNHDMRELADAFERKYGVKVVFWRGNAQKVLQRTVSEAQAGRHEADVVQAPALVMQALHEEKLLQPLYSSNFAQLRPEALNDSGTWVAVRAYVYVQAYNTDKVSRDELPASYEDLLEPRWKGRLGAEAKAQEWFRTLLQQMGEEKGLALFRRIVAENGVSVRSGNSLLNNLVVSGEVPFALSVYNYMPEKSMSEGAPINYVALKPTIAYNDGIGVAAAARHPHAAALFVDFMLDEGMKLMKKQQHLTMHKQDDEVLDRFDPVFIDAAAMLKDYDDWTVFYQDVIAGRPAQLPSEGEKGKQ